MSTWRRLTLSQLRRLAKPFSMLLAAGLLMICAGVYLIEMLYRHAAEGGDGAPVSVGLMGLSIGVLLVAAAVMRSARQRYLHTLAMMDEEARS
ncbi:hypothetical protein CAter10_2173 [Collimonas arenae]|uniref:hypothetical protein n=1 Tax=Collimonas arenae TaxID=279058 RepID=UPI00078BD564|nr:hypothetical protein [Collimonas arenae]AMO99866.1 hypothetical protein CAter10_2173 [Collimonas arenae]